MEQHRGAESSQTTAAEEGNPHAILMDRLQSRRALVGVVGMGYVGLPLVCAIAASGFPTIGLDVDAAKIEALNAGRSYLRQYNDDVIENLRSKGFEATSNVENLRRCDAILICVPTPLTAHRQPDMTFVISTAESLVPVLRPGQLVVLESTTYPGTTAEVLAPILQRSGLTIEQDLFIANSPEREDPGNSNFATSNIPKVVGADGPLSVAAAQALYGAAMECIVPVSSSRTAEAVKLTENIFRSVNIALVNELKQVYEVMGIDVWEVIDAASTKPFGFMPFYPGPGLGGHCIPIDPFYLTWKAREYDTPVRFVELAGEINTAMPNVVVNGASAALNERTGKGLNGARVLVVGVAYKKNIDDCRESPGLKIIELLERQGAKVDYHDPFVPEIGKTRSHPTLAGRRSVALDRAALGACDLVMIVTDHSAIDWDEVVANARLVVDTRNATRDVSDNRERIVKA